MSRVQIEADGPLQSVTGDDIDAVVDGDVTAGTEEYGITIENAHGVTIDDAFHLGDIALPSIKTDISVSEKPVQNGSFDIVYKASIDSETPASEYQQTVFFTISQNI